VPRQLPSACLPFEEQPAAARNVLKSLAVTLRNTKFNIQKFYMVLTLRSVVYGSRNKQRLLPYAT
jgi:hypothetical protein